MVFLFSFFSEFVFFSDIQLLIFYQLNNGRRHNSSYNLLLCLAKMSKNHKYMPNFAKEFVDGSGKAWTQQGKDDVHAFCIVCPQQINLRSMGKAAITQHGGYRTHKNAIKDAASLRYFCCLIFTCFISCINYFRTIKSLFPSHDMPTLEDDKVTAAEGSFSYHVALHAQSFLSMDCFSADGFLRALFPDSYGSH